MAKDRQVTIEDIYDDAFSGTEDPYAEEFGGYSSDRREKTIDEVLKEGKPSFYTTHGDEKQRQARAFVRKHYKIRTAADFIFSILWTILLLAGSAIAVVLFSLRLYVVPNENMAPELDTQHIAVVNVLAYKYRTPQRGDVIIANGTAVRVIGLPGETITLKDGEIYADEKKLIEQNYLPYNTQTEPLTDQTTFEVKDNEYFVLFDNRKSGGDSRLGENISLSSVTGKIITAF